MAGGVRGGGQWALAGVRTDRIIVGCRKIKEKYRGYSDANSILYVVYDSERSITGCLVANLSRCQRLDLLNTRQMVLHFPRNLQRGDILVPRNIQDIHLSVQHYSLHRSADRRINWTRIEVPRQPALGYRR